MIDLITQKIADCQTFYNEGLPRIFSQVFSEFQLANGDQIQFTELKQEDPADEQLPNLSLQQCLLAKSSYGKAWTAHFKIAGQADLIKIPLFGNQQGKLLPLPYITEEGTWIIDGRRRISIGVLALKPDIYFFRDEWREDTILCRVNPQYGPGFVLEYRHRSKKKEMHLMVNVGDGLEHNKIAIGELCGRIAQFAPYRQRIADMLKVSCQPNQIFRQLSRQQAEKLRASYLGTILALGDNSANEDKWKKIAECWGEPTLSMPRQGFDAEHFAALIAYLVKSAAGDNWQDDLYDLANRDYRWPSYYLERMAMATLYKARSKIAAAACKGKQFELLATRYLSALARKLIAVLKNANTFPILEQTNLLSELSHHRQVIYAEGFHQHQPYKLGKVRHIHPSHRGRLCLVETPESDRIGLNLHLASAAWVDASGAIECDPTNDGSELLGIAALLTPFVAHDDPVRLMMAAKNSKQALPLLHREKPRVRSGWEQCSLQMVPQKGRREYSMIDGDLALGVNLLVGYMCWYGYNFEDAVVVSETAARKLISLTDNDLWERLRIGDKIMGRHGNKGIVARILPDHQMPQIMVHDQWRPLEIILNPLGVVSRQNIGQLFEIAVSWLASAKQWQVFFPFKPVVWIKIQEALARDNYPRDGKFPVRIPDHGQLPKRVAAGYQYFMKLDHNAEDKKHFRATGPYQLTSEQPTASKKRHGGQRIGEMEIWALLAHDSFAIVDELMGVKSDDVHAREHAASRSDNAQAASGNASVEENSPAASNGRSKENQRYLSEAWRCFICLLRGMGIKTIFHTCSGAIANEVISYDHAVSCQDIESIEFALASAEEIREWGQDIIEAKVLSGVAFHDKGLKSEKFSERTNNASKFSATSNSTCRYSIPCSIRWLIATICRYCSGLRYIKRCVLKIRKYSAPPMSSNN